MRSKANDISPQPQDVSGLHDKTSKRLLTPLWKKKILYLYTVPCLLFALLLIFRTANSNNKPSVNVLTASPQEQLAQQEDTHNRIQQASESSGQTFQSNENTETKPQVTQIADARKTFINSDQSLEFKYPDGWTASGEKYYFSSLRSAPFTNDIFPNTSKQGFFVLIFAKKKWGTEWGNPHNTAVQDSYEIVFDNPTPDQGDKAYLAYTGTSDSTGSFLWTMNLHNLPHESASTFLDTTDPTGTIPPRTFEVAEWNITAYFAYEDTSYFRPVTTPINIQQINLNKYHEQTIEILESIRVKPSLVAY